MRKTDVCILGAGIVGVSAALHLQARGRDVVLLDRRVGRRGDGNHRVVVGRGDRGGHVLGRSGVGRGVGRGGGRGGGSGC